MQAPGIDIEDGGRLSCRLKRQALVDALWIRARARRLQAQAVLRRGRKVHEKIDRGKDAKSPPKTGQGLVVFCRKGKKDERRH